VTAPASLEVLEDLITATVGPAAPEVDRTGTFPRPSLQALQAAGFGGLLSAPEVGGRGGTLADAAAVVRRLAAVDASVAMVYGMHLAASAAIEQLGPRDVREAIAAGEHLSTLAFSEKGSRSQFWATLSSATRDGDGVVLDAEKSWVTSAGEADSYVWSSRPLAAAGPQTLWLVPSSTPGLKVAAPFDGLGLRGNASSPVTAIGARVGLDAMLGADGAGLDLALAHVLPVFQVVNASASLGLCDAALAAAIGHVTTARFEHLDQSLAQQPVVRHRLAALVVQRDAASTLLDDTCAALSTGRADAPLRMLEVKAAAAEAALTVTSEAMRLAGGAAFRHEVGLERALRDARAAAVMGPTTDALYDMLGRAVCGLPLL
jgi:alkylation response protein AidB-like acyl-CoA dehydrogenase